MKTSTFTKSVIVTLAAVLGAVFTFNYVIDPYGKNQRFMSRYNAIKAVRDERISKFSLLEQFPGARSFFFGSSKALFLNPVAFERSTGSPALNMAFSSATANEYYLYIKYLLDTRKVDHIVIGIDFFAYAEGFQSNGTLPQGLRNYFKLDDNYSLGNYFAFTMLKKSYRTLLYNLDTSANAAQPETYTDRGQILKPLYLKAKRDPAEFKRYIDENVIQKAPRWGAKTSNIDADRLTSLINIKKLCTQHKVRLHLFTSPLYIKQITMKHNFFASQQELLRQIVEHVGPVLDFNGITRVNTEAAAFIDEFHYSYAVADVILQQITTGTSTQAYAGTKVTRDNIDTYLRTVNQRLTALDTTVAH